MNYHNSGGITGNIGLADNPFAGQQTNNTAQACVSYLGYYYPPYYYSDPSWPFKELMRLSEEIGRLKSEIERLKK